METEKIVTELYALRAGLSLIAKEMDKLDSEQIAAEKQKTAAIAQARAIEANYAKTAAAYEDDYLKATQAVEKAKEYRFSARKDLDKVVGYVNYDKKVYEARKRKKKQVLKVEIFFILLHLVIAGLAYFSIFLLNFNGYVFIPILAISLGIGITEWILPYQGYDISDMDVDFGIINGGLYFFFFWLVFLFNAASYLAFMIIGFCGTSDEVSIIAILVVIAVSTMLCLIIACMIIVAMPKACRYSNYWEEKKQYPESRYAEANADYNRLRAEKEDLERKKKEHEVTLSMSKNECELRCKKIDEWYKSTCAATEKKYTPIGMEIWNTLAKTYGHLLDVRDWKILDLVIWQLETRRADSIKEALQLADREVQTDRIVGALQSASNAICSQIRMGFGSLQAQLDYNFHSLANQFAASARDIASRIDDSTRTMQASQESNMLAMNRNLEQITSQASLQTALLEKADTSSKDLLAAVEKLQKTKFKIDTDSN